MTRPQETTELHCPACGYNLFGIESEKCPECGLEIDRTQAAISRIPWEHRDRIGSIRAFFRTVILATIHPKKLAAEMNRPVSYAHAKRFRHICAILAWLPTCAVVGLLLINQDYLGTHSPASVWEQIFFAALTAASFWVFFLCVTGFPSIFFHPTRLSSLQQNRAIALSYYSASAPWSGLGIIYAGSALVFGIGMLNLNQFVEIGAGLLTLCTLSLALIAIAAPLRLISLTARSGVSRKILLGLSMPLAWGALFCVVAIGIPLAAIYLAVMIFSMHSM
jgi:hypothetical protein